jgi:hypothetical protein
MSSRAGDQQPRPMQRALDLRQRREQAAGEDVLLDPVRPAPLLLVGASGKQIDWRLIRPPPGLSARSQASKKAGKYSCSDRLEHLDRDDRVELALDVAVVAQLDVDEVRARHRATRSRPARAAPREMVIVVTRQPSSPAA